MNLLLINGSPRLFGNTSQILYTPIQIPFYKQIVSSIISQLVGLIMLKS